MKDFEVSRVLVCALRVGIGAWRRVKGEVIREKGRKGEKKGKGEEMDFD